jgi:sporulation-control protein
MKKYLASVGIGNASVDTVLSESTVRPGDAVPAEVHVTGGSAEQDVNYIELEIETRYRTEEDGYREVTVGTARLTDGFTIAPDTDETYETDVQVPYETPLSMGDAKVWVETDLDISMAVDPEDKDHLDVQPTDRMQAVFDAADRLGLSFYEADCEADPHGRYVSNRRFFQEFEFKAKAGRFASDLDEVEMVFAPSADELAVFVEVDERGGLLSEMAGTDERRTRFSLASADVDAAAESLERAITENV